MSTSFVMLLGATGEGGHEAAEWVLPMPNWVYGAIALFLAVALLLIAWAFRNAGHTLMNPQDVVAHEGHGAPGHGSGHGPAH